MRYPISVCMIVKNEESLLGPCLDSISPFVEEVIVVDTGSTDRTPEVATQRGALVHRHAWQDDFSAARNVSLSLATQPLVLVMDADELFVPESEPALAEYVQNVQDRAGLVQLKNQTVDPTVYQMMQLPRIFPNRPEFRYERRIHEQLRDRGQVPETVMTSILLDHSGYLAGNIAEKNKLQRNLRLLEQEQADNPRDLYVLYQLGKTHYMAQSYAQASVFFQAVIDELSQQPWVVPAFLPSLFVQYAFSLLHLREFSRLFFLLETGIDLYPDHTHLYFLYGQALIEFQDPTRFREIPTVFEYCLQLGDNSIKYESPSGVGSFMAHYNLGVYYEVTGDLDRARGSYQLAAEAGYVPAKNRLQALDS